jgi:2-oxoglutarate ferredoxin oxidoreductase subunit delta
MTPKTKPKREKTRRAVEKSPSQVTVSDTDTPSEEKRRFEINIFRGWCKCCGICAAFCPRECIRLDEDGAPYVEDADRCTGCGWCEIHCPDFAISVHERKAKEIEAPED